MQYLEIGEKLKDITISSFFWRERETEREKEKLNGFEPNLA